MDRVSDGLKNHVTVIREMKRLANVLMCSCSAMEKLEFFIHHYISPHGKL